MTIGPILVIGPTGQVAQALASLGHPGLILAGRADADLADTASPARTLEKTSPALVINTGAFTSVDGAESEPVAAMAINTDGPASLAALCGSTRNPLIHLSTDCIFDGRKASAYTPGDVAGPLGVYGATKLADEYAVAAAASRYLIIRVSSAVSHFGTNFVRTMLNAARSREEVSVVDDQFGCPTHAPALSAALLNIAQVACAPGFTAWETYHLAGSGETDRASLTRAIYTESTRHGGLSNRVQPVSTADYPTSAARPLNARLDMSLTSKVFGVSLPDWRAGLVETVAILLKETGPQ